MGVQPGGTLTFLFTDIEGSTLRWQEHPDAMGEALARHDSIVASAGSEAGGSMFKHTGDGACLAFSSPSDAVSAAVAIQRALLREDWSSVGGLAVRMALHSGEASQRDGDWFGPALNRVARIMAVAHGGQVLVSGATAILLADAAPDGISLLDLGEHRLRDLVQVEHLHQLLAPGLPATFPRVRSLEAFDHNLPVQRTSFVGREADVNEVRERLTKSALVTLTGIGGAGKTRLALEAAAALLDRHSGGVFFVDLSAVGDGDLVVSAVATALDLQRGATAAGAANDQLADLLGFLSGREVLLVLDNCEHLIDDCAELVDEVLATCPTVTVLATSREPLSLDGEQVMRVSSLATDDAQADAVRLFHDRAAAADRSYDPHQHEAAAVEICQRLDGIPLAIELAAAQVSRLAPGDVAARLDDRFTLLTGGRRRVQRQQTLEATLEWSHELLSQDERLVLRRLAVFASPFSAADAEHVAGGGPLPPERVLPVLGRLVEHSLVAPVDDAVAGRYRLLETVRIYAQAKLAAAGEADAVRHRHVDALLDILESVDELVRNEDVAVATELLRRVEDLRAAMEWCHGRGDGDRLARLVGGSFGLYWIHGLGDEGQQWAETALGHDISDPDVRSRVWQVLGISRMVRGDLLEMQEPFQRGVEEASSPEVHWSAQGWLGFSLMVDLERANAVLDGIDVTESDDAAPWRSRTHFLKGAVALFHRDFDLAVAHAEAAIGSYDAPPTSYMRRFLPVWRSIAMALAGRPGAIDDDLDDLIELREAGWWAYSAWWALAVAAAVRDDEDSLTAHLLEASKLVRRYWVPLAELDCLLVVALHAAKHGDAERANRILGAVRGRSAVVTLRSPGSYAIYFEVKDLVRSAVEVERGRALFSEGRGIPVSQLLDEELDRLSAKTGPGSDPEA